MAVSFQYSVSEQGSAMAVCEEEQGAAGIINRQGGVAGGHLDEPGCQPTGMQISLRGSGRAEKQTHPFPSFNRGPRPPSKAAAWVLSRRRVVGQ